MEPTVEQHGLMIESMDIMTEIFKARLEGRDCDDVIDKLDEKFAELLQIGYVPTLPKDDRVEKLEEKVVELEQKGYIPTELVANKESPKENAGESRPKANVTKGMKQEKFDAINNQLEALGFPQSEEIGNCARAAIYNGFIRFSGKQSDLKQVIVSDTLKCGHKCDAVLRDLLRQPDWGGEDYDEGSEAATVVCSICDPDSDDEDFYENYGNNRAYVTRICQGKPRFDQGDGKFHNHCTGCVVFGDCVGDFRYRHCKRCDHHYYAGLGGIFSCDLCGKNYDSSIDSENSEDSDSEIENGYDGKNETIDESGKTRPVLMRESIDILKRIFKARLEGKECDEDDVDELNEKFGELWQQIDGKSAETVPNKESPTENREESRPTANVITKGMKQEKFDEINKQLEALGFPQSEEIGNCARAAIYNGFIKFTGIQTDLDQVILSDTLECGHECDAVLGDLLRQPDWGGQDYDEGSEAATVVCSVCDPNSDDEDFYENYGNNRAYVTRICQGDPMFDYGRGKFHNHCSSCEMFGACIGDYRNRHCKRCEHHYYAGAGGIFSCDLCGRNYDSSTDDEESEDSDSDIESGDDSDEGDQLQCVNM